MISIEIFAAFDFLDKETRVGQLIHDRQKGESTYIFEYDKSFLSRFPGTKISNELGLYQGKQAKSGNIFAFLGDALPDRWGRALIDKRENIVAKTKGRPPRSFNDFDYLVHLDDTTRMGALRFKHNGEYIGTNYYNYPIPVISELEDIIRESQEYEKALAKNQPPNDTWINNLWAQGSSLGGARPKANIIDNGALYIAKIPSVKDSYDIALWEHFAMRLARKAGITTAETRLLKFPTSEYHTLLSKRFDRNGNKRIHYASSITISGATDGDGASTNKGYTDIANAIIGDMNIINPMKNMEELYRRVAFNIAVGNHDDHFRNHGFLLTEKGWTLSPAFDINPTNYMTQSLMISPASNDSSLNELLKASEYYMLDTSRAKEIINEVTEAVSTWKETAKEAGISETESRRFSTRLNTFSNKTTNVW